MILKVFSVVVAVAVIAAQDHGHAYSSQSFVLHHTNGNGHNAEIQHGHHETAYHGYNLEHHQDHKGRLEQHNDHNKHYGHAFSSQNSVLHQVHGTEHNEGQHYGHHNQHHIGHHGHASSSQSIVLHHTHDDGAEQREAQNYGNNKEYYYGHHDEYNGQQEHQGHAATSQNIVLDQTLGAEHQERQYYGHYNVHQHGNHGNQHGYYGHASSSQNLKQYNDGHVTKHVDYYANPKYEFAYEVKDPLTHDHKYQHEARDGDVVKGVYKLDQPDGTVRIVEYYADKRSGFNANVKYQGHAEHIVPKHHHHHH